MLLIDNSAWARLASARLDEQRTDQVASWIENGEIAVCVPFLLEAGYSARSGPDHKRVIGDLVRLPSVEITPEISRSAIRAQGEFALVGHHRVAPVDLLIAAAAHSESAGVLHYDRDYDLIAEHSSLAFPSEWLAAAGSL